MLDSKNWWQSRTMWVNIVATMFAIAGAAGLLPSGLDEETVVTAIMGLIALANVALRLTTKHTIA
jgi:hypothetical protein